MSVQCLARPSWHCMNLCISLPFTSNLRTLMFAMPKLTARGSIQICPGSWKGSEKRHPAEKNFCRWWLICVQPNWLEKLMFKIFWDLLALGLWPFFTSIFTIMFEKSQLVPIGFNWCEIPMRLKFGFSSKHIWNSEQWFHSGASGREETWGWWSEKRCRLRELKSNKSFEIVWHYLKFIFLLFKFMSYYFWIFLGFLGYHHPNIGIL